MVGRLKRSLNKQKQAIGFERFFDKVIGAALDRADRGLDIAVAGDHDHREVGVQGLDHVEQLQPVQAAAAHPDIEDEERRLAGADGRQGGLRILGGAHLIALISENGGHQLANVRLVVHDDHIAGHALTFRSSWAELGAVRAAGKDNITRAPGLMVASVRTRSPPWSSRMRLTIANPRPVPLALVVT